MWVRGLKFYVVALCVVRESCQKNVAVQLGPRVVAKWAGAQAEGVAGTAVVEVGNGAAAGAGEV